MKMKYRKIAGLFVLGLLVGCSTTNLDLSSADNHKAYAGSLTLTWQYPKSAEILLNGKRYVGEWSDRRCITPTCRGEYESVQGIHRSHIRRGAAKLLADDNSALNCEWVSHFKEYIGICSSSDGMQYRLQSEPSPPGEKSDA
ncbi:hypothetical protein F8A87_06545 [Betaproteobacteria bacterium SCN2]|nr:hypothetical protein F8A87_06545 [Betaproteobacteria bacterium SCN2]